MEKGFSLLELLITISISAILATLAIPLAQNFWANHKINLEQQRLVRMLNYAHNQALIHQQMISLCMSKDEKTCSGTWSNGLIVFLDPMQAHKIISSSEILKVMKPLSKDLNVIWKGFPSPKYLSFHPFDFRRTNNGKFVLSMTLGGKMFERQVVVSKSGKIRMS